MGFSFIPYFKALHVGFFKYLNPEATSLHAISVIDKPLDWTSLWQSCASRGPAVLLESSGPMGDASHWVILAGGAGQEVLGKQGQCYFVSDGKKTLYEPGIWALLDEMGKTKIRSNRFRRDWPRPGLGCSVMNLATVLPFRYGTPMDSAAPDFYFLKPSSLIAFNRQTSELYQFGENILVLNETGAKADIFHVGPGGSQGFG